MADSRAGSDATATGSDDPLVRKVEELKGLFGTFKTETEENRNYYNLNFANEVVPASWQGRLDPVIPPTARHAVDEAVDHILTQARIRVPKKVVDEDKILDEQGIAEKKRRWLNATWQQVGQRYNLLGDMRKTLISEGKIVVRKVIDWSLIPKQPESGKRNKRARERYREAVEKIGRENFIWDYQILDNLTVYEDPSNHRDPQYVFIEYDIYAEEARRLFPKEGDPGPEDDRTNLTARKKEGWRDDNDYTKVQYMEYWSRDRLDSNGEVVEAGKFIQWVNWERVHEADNPYPYVPIAIDDAGWGENRHMAAPHEKFVGMTLATRKIFVAEARQMTSWEAVAELTAFGMFTARNRRPGNKWQLGPGEIIDLDGDEGTPGAESFEAVKLPEVPVSVIQLVEKTTQIANSTLKMQVLGGQPLKGVETATEADQQIRNASAKLSGPVAAMERVIAKLSRWMLMDIELVLEAPVVVYGAAGDSNADASARLTPTDVGGFYEVGVELRTSDEESVNMVKSRFWAEMYRIIPFLSAWTAMEKGEIADDPSMEMVKRAAEDVFLSPEMQLVRTATGANSIGELATFIQQLTEQNAPTPGGGGGPEGGPPSPGSGSLPSGLPSDGSGQGVAPPTEGDIVGQSLNERDILQGPAFIRG